MMTLPGPCRKTTSALRWMLRCPDCPAALLPWPTWLPQRKSGTFVSHWVAAVPLQMACFSVRETQLPAIDIARSISSGVPSSFRAAISSLRTSSKTSLNSVVLMSQRRIIGKGLCVTQCPPSPSASPSAQVNCSPGSHGSISKTSGPSCHGVSSGNAFGSRRQVPIPIQSATVKDVSSATHFAEEICSFPSSSCSNSKRILPTAFEGRSSRILFLKAFVCESCFASTFFLSCSFAMTMEALSL
mmetsp:Transcript_51976/g.153251  ORF Transcript_51976/g.153251 Transcript_51976/m.153251 type:complete len:243 (-) Transcript_51976:431-1159(-)